MGNRALLVFLRYAGKEQADAKSIAVLRATICLHVNLLSPSLA
jgi:hypothetical protein